MFLPAKDSKYHLQFTTFEYAPVALQTFRQTAR